MPSNLACGSGRFTLAFSLALLLVNCLPCSATLVFQRLGGHPASQATDSSAVLNLANYEGKIYIGYGNLRSYPVVVATCYDPADKRFHLEHSIGSDIIGIMRALGGCQWIPHASPVHGEDFEELSRKSVGVWHEVSPLDCVEANDIARGTDGSLFLAGATGSALIARSKDGGLTWSRVGSDPKRSAYRWCFIMDDIVYVEGGTMSIDGESLTQSNLFIAYSNMYKPLTISPPGKRSYMLALAARPLSPSYPNTSSLLIFDGITVREAMAGVMDFCVDGEFLYLSRFGYGISRAKITSLGELAFEKVPTAYLPIQASAICVQNGDIYVGDAGGEI